MTDGAATRLQSTNSSPWFGFLPALCALAALGAYAFLAVVPTLGRQGVPLAAPFAAGAFALLQLFVPSCRPSREHLLSPLNWALLAFFLQLVVMPLAISWAGPAPGLLPYLPSSSAMDRAIVISMGAFGAFGMGCALSALRGRTPSRAYPVRVPTLALVFSGGIGILGLLLKFGSFAEMFAALAEPSRLLAMSAEPQGTLAGAASTFLRPFLLNAVVMTWCLWIDRRGATGPRLLHLALTTLAAAAVVIVGATYGLNRAAFIVPLVAMAAAYSLRVRRLSLVALAALGLMLGGLAVVPGLYRSSDLSAATLARSSSARTGVFRVSDLGPEVQIYAGAPQFAGYLLEVAERRQELFTPGLLVGSLLSPIPILGKRFRDASGPAVYNRLIYGSVEAADQIIPFEAEVYLCLGPVGLLFAFVGIGLVIGHLQRAFSRAASSFDAYALQFTAMWVAFLVQGSLAAVAQVFVFFFWPIYVYALYRHRAQAARSP